jgi:GTP-binding protein HflX
MRDVTLPSGRKIIISDTVGFVSSLPTSLIAAFRATLEEVLEADLILHVRDVSHPDSDAQNSDVLDVLEELGVEQDRLGKMVEVRNKVDLLSIEEREAEEARSDRNPNEILLSAVNGHGCSALLELVDQRLNANRPVVEISLAFSEGEAIAWLYDRGEVLDRRDEEVSAYFRVGMDAVDVARFEHRFPAITTKSV